MGESRPKWVEVCGFGNHLDHRGSMTIVCGNPEYVQVILPCGHHLTLAGKLLGKATLILHEMRTSLHGYSGGGGGGGRFG